MSPLYIGYFTKGTAYQTEAVECIQSLDSFGLEHEFTAVNNLGSWVRNCAQKPEVILQMMQKHDGRPLVYLDADARVRRRPTLFESIPNVIDIGCHYRLGVELLSGTLFFNPTAAARALVTEWADHCRMSPGEWDQRVLEGVVADGDYNVYRLPPEYVAVWDDPKMGNEATWVISHHQASRRLAKTV